MSSRAFLIYFAVVLQLLLYPLHVFSAGDEIDQLSSIPKRYDEAKFYYNQLQTNTKLSTSRENWLKGARNFRQIYLSNPKSDLAPGCLFMLGRIYGDMNDHFKNKDDLEESISYLKDTARLFPQNRLADDSFFALAQIYLDKQNNPKKAAESLVKIVTDYPNGDMRPMAEELLKFLSKEHDIPLPKIMISSSGDS